MQASEFLQKLKETDPEKLLEIKGLGKVLVQNLTDFVNSERFEKIQNDFLELEKNNQGLQIQVPVVDKNLPLFGQKICITGTFKIGRNEIKDLLEKQGASVVGQVSSATTILLAGEDAGSKLEKAKKLGIRVVTELSEVLPLVK
jgi:DNA ligase (NAD+)